MSDPNWDDLIKAQGVDPSELDAYINAQVPAVYGSSEAKIKKPRKPRPKPISYPDRIPTADAMLDYIDRNGYSAALYESMIFDTWLEAKATEQGLKPAKRMTFTAFMQRYYGENAPDRLED